MENVEINFIFSEIKKIMEDLDYLKRIVEFGKEDIILTKRKKINERCSIAKEKGELLTLEAVSDE